MKASASESCPVRRTGRTSPIPCSWTEPVNLLWMMLLTGEEYELVKEQGTDPIMEKKGADPAAWNLV